jgi:S1-C subfamily serine protease
LELTRLFSEHSAAVVGLIAEFASAADGAEPPHFPAIFGTGFFVDPCGLVATNGHVIRRFSTFPRNPKTGNLPVSAVCFFAADEGRAWQMLVVDAVYWCGVTEFSSSDRWFGKDLPDFGFVQLAVRDVPVLRLATEPFYAQVGTEIATIGYPLGTAPMTTFEKINQLSPMIRRGIISSLFPHPTEYPHGFTVDIMQQPGSSGSPVLRASDGVAIGIVTSGYPQTNLSFAEPAHVVRKALDDFKNQHLYQTGDLPTLTSLRAKCEKLSGETPFTWEKMHGPATS